MIAFIAYREREQFGKRGQDTRTATSISQRELQHEPIN
jgi:hypothetical protein